MFLVVGAWILAKYLPKPTFPKPEAGLSPQDPSESGTGEATPGTHYLQAGMEEQ